MARVEVKPIPGILHPKGEHIIKIMYDNNEPPKNYIWCRGEDEYYYWDGKQWATYEFGSAQEKEICCSKKNCCCNYITEDDLKAKFEKFKKDLLTAVLKLTKTGADVDVENLTRLVNNIDNRVTNLENADLDGYATETWVGDNYQPKGNYLTEHQSLANYYTKQEIDNKQLDEDQLLDLGFVKMIDIRLADYQALETKQEGVVYNIIDAEAYHYDPTELNNRVTALDGSVSNLGGTIRSIQDNIGTISSDVASLKAIDHSQFATEQYVNNKISDLVNSAPAALDTLNELATALNNDANFATTITNQLANKADKSEIPTLTSQLTNDSGFISESEEYVTAAALNDLNDRVVELENGGYDDSTLSNRVTTLENTMDGLSDVATSGSYNDLVDVPNNMATQTWVNDNYEPKFTDLTNATDPEAAAQTHTSDNKVYITEVIEPEQGGE